MTTFSQRYDVVVLGSGHNGLVCAASLAKKGRKVLVVEQRKILGGLAAGEEFHPGFTSPGFFHDTTKLRRSVVAELELAKYGLKLRAEEAPVFAPEANGRGLLLWRDPKRAVEELAPHSQKDAQRYGEYRTFINRIAPVLKRVFDDAPPDVVNMSFPGVWDLMKTAVSLRLLGKADMMEVLRITPMCVADWLNEWFETPVLKAALAGPAIHHEFVGPWSPGTNMNLLLSEAFAELPVLGGPQALAKALVDCCKAQGVTFRNEAKVKSILIENGAAKGVELESGEKIQAQQIAASCDPKSLFLKLVAPDKIAHRFETNIANVRSRGVTAKIDLALDRYPELAGRPSLKAEYVRTGEYFDQMERAFDHVKYGETSTHPIFDCYVPTLEAPELAPQGKHVMSVLVHFAPHALRGGWNEAQKEKLTANAMAALSQSFPGLNAAVIAKRVTTPVELERDLGLWGGHPHHGEHAADQLLVRPTPECSRYKTPVEGLFLCGSGAHPGGGITGAPGQLAARAMVSV